MKATRIPYVTFCRTQIDEKYEWYTELSRYSLRRKADTQRSVLAGQIEAVVLKFKQNESERLAGSCTLLCSLDTVTLTLRTGRPSVS
jgi:hypothetical protein